MEASRLRPVRIDVAGQLVEISQPERDALLAELCFVPDTKSIRERLEIDGAIRAVEFSGEQRLLLHAALARWEEDMVLPDGIARLLLALDEAPAAGVTGASR